MTDKINTWIKDNELENIITYRHSENVKHSSIVYDGFIFLLYSNISMIRIRDNICYVVYSYRQNVSFLETCTWSGKRYKMPINEEQVVDEIGLRTIKESMLYYFTNRKNIDSLNIIDQRTTDRMWFHVVPLLDDFRTKILKSIFNNLKDDGNVERIVNGRN